MLKPIVELIDVAKFETDHREAFMALGAGTKGRLDSYEGCKGILQPFIFQDLLWIAQSNEEAPFPNPFLGDISLWNPLTKAWMYWSPNTVEPEDEELEEVARRFRTPKGG